MTETPHTNDSAFTGAEDDSTPKVHKGKSVGIAAARIGNALAEPGAEMVAVGKGASVGITGADLDPTKGYIDTPAPEGNVPITRAEMDSLRKQFKGQRIVIRTATQPNRKQRRMTPERAASEAIQKAEAAQRNRYKVKRK